MHKRTTKHATTRPCDIESSNGHLRTGIWLHVHRSLHVHRASHDWHLATNILGTVTTSRVCTTLPYNARAHSVITSPLCTPSVCYTEADRNAELKVHAECLGSRLPGSLPARVSLSHSSALQPSGSHPGSPSLLTGSHPSGSLPARGSHLSGSLLSWGSLHYGLPPHSQALAYRAPSLLRDLTS